MTEKQKKCIEFIQYFTEINGFPPSIREIARGMGVSSPATVKGMIDRLIEKGLIKRDALKARGLELTNRITGIPLVGNIKAGTPILSEEHIENFIQIQTPLKYCPDCFFLRVDGDSMQNKGILHGDLVMIKPETQIQSGDIAAFRLNGEVTLKTFIQHPESIYLQPENDQYAPIPVTANDDFQIIGKMVSLIRDLENIFDIAHQ